MLDHGRHHRVGDADVVEINDFVRAGIERLVELPTNASITLFATPESASLITSATGPAARTLGGTDFLVETAVTGASARSASGASSAEAAAAVVGGGATSSVSTDDSAAGCGSAVEETIAEALVVGLPGGLAEARSNRWPTGGHLRLAPSSSCAESKCSYSPMAEYALSHSLSQGFDSLERPDIHRNAKVGGAQIRFWGLCHPVSINPPHPGPLPKGEEIHRLPVAESCDSGRFEGQALLLPLPLGGPG